MPRMAKPVGPGIPARTNSRLDAFLRRHLAPEVYDAVRTCEPCIVVSQSEKHTLKYVVLSDRLIYLTENPPKSIRRVVALRDVMAIDLKENNGPVFWGGKEPRNLTESFLRYHQDSSTLSKDSTVCPTDDKKHWLHGQSAFRPLPTTSRRSRQSTSAPGNPIRVPSCTTNTEEPEGLPDHKDSPSEIPFKCNGNGNEFYLGNSLLVTLLQSKPNLEKKESELHLSEEKIKHFSQLKSELFLKDSTLKKTLCLTMELKVAAQKNFILKRLFWKTSDLFYFLVNKLHEYLPESRDQNALQNKSQRADEQVVCIEIIQTLGLIFRETENESSRLNTLASKKGTLFTLLVILISKPQIPKPCLGFDIQLVADSTFVKTSFDAKLQKLILEYTNTATALLYEILLVFQQGNLGLRSTKFAISWMMSFLQSCPSIEST